MNTLHVGHVHVGINIERNVYKCVIFGLIEKVYKYFYLIGYVTNYSEAK